MEEGVGHVQEEAVPGAFIFCSVVPCVVGQVPDEGDGESRRCIFFAVGAKPRKAKQLIAAFVEFYNLSALVIAAVLLHVFVISVQGQKLQN